MKINDLFKIENAHSKGYESHSFGLVPFITNGFFNNGCLGTVTPLYKEKVFMETCICVSAFCEATVQQPSFLPRGNGGSGLIVLIPKKPMCDDELFFYAAQINQQSWRFSFGRMVIEARVSNLEIGHFKKSIIEWTVSDLTPKEHKPTNIKLGEIKEIQLTDICTIERKYAPYMNQINASITGTPYVTTTEMDNGISIFCKEKPNFKKHTVTVSLDGICGTSFYQFDDFISGEKTAVLELKTGSNPYLLFYIAAVIRSVSWRFNYGIKLSVARLHGVKIPFPINKDGEIDNALIKIMVTNTYGSKVFQKYIPAKA